MNIEEGLRMSDDSTLFMEYLELQGTLEFVTKSELHEQVRERGGSISDRQITTYVSEGLIPKSARIGSRTGVYPGIIVDLVVWIGDSRKRGMSVESIKELLPLWRHLRRAIVHDQRLDLAEFEYVARQHVRSREASYAVPALVRSFLPCPSCHPEDLAAIEFVHKDGEVLRLEDPGQPITLGFVIAEQDEETGEARQVASMRMALPVVEDGSDPSTIVLGIANGVQLPADDRRHEKV